MLYELYTWWKTAFEAEVSSGQEGWAHSWSFFNIFQYITVRALLACLLSFVLSLVLGPRIIRKLISMKVGQPIRTAAEVHKLHELHGAKAGTPTMGGVMIIGTVLIAIFICGRLMNPFLAVTTFVMLSLGLLGFLDDYTKVVKKNSDGVSAKTKLCWQFGVGLLAALFLYFKKETGMFDLGIDSMTGDANPMKITDLAFPLFKQAVLPLGIFAIPFFVAIIVGASNAVNLTDGLDGLATGCTISTSMAYAGVAYLAHHHFLAVEYLTIPHNPLLGELVIFLGALVGAGFGFLWFNCHPAKVFMGDTGSLAIGGAIGTAAICTKQELLLVIVGGVFVMEALSVILQVGSFKLRKKRIFKMAPIHHHFELLGWHESQVIIRFWILSLILALSGLALLKVL